ncbi:MAG: hypothetical protein ACOYZ8_08510 [Chloroflexota bacterium]
MPGAKPSLNPDEILKAEFDYIAQSAFQANEDRSKAASFFLISVGSLVAAIFGAQELSTLKEVPLTLYRVLAGLFFVLTVLGGLTIFQLARLREAWIEAAFAMNQIKEYYAKRSSLDLMNAFRWRTETIPRQYKPDSISYYTALEVALLSGLTFGACVYFLQLGVPYTNCLWAFTLSSGALAFFLQLFIYKRLLSKGRRP